MEKAHVLLMKKAGNQRTLNIEVNEIESDTVQIIRICAQ